MSKNQKKKLISKNLHRYSKAFFPLNWQEIGMTPNTLKTEFTDSATPSRSMFLEEGGSVNENSEIPLDVLDARLRVSDRFRARQKVYEDEAKRVAYDSKYVTRDKMIDGYMKRYSDTVNGINNAKINMVPEDDDQFMGSTSLDQITNLYKVTLYNNRDEHTPYHEFSHIPGSNLIINNLIVSRFGNRSKELGLYYGLSDEIYAYSREFLDYLSLQKGFEYMKDPTHVYTDEELNTLLPLWKEYFKKRGAYLNFDINDLRFLYNDVAYNPTNTLNNYA